MTFLPPGVARSAAPAEWITSRIDVFDKAWVAGMVGPDFQAYARIFHPLGDEPDAPSWADVAQRNGRTMHAGAQWSQINPAPAELRDGRSFPGDPSMRARSDVVLQWPNVPNLRHRDQDAVHVGRGGQACHGGSPIIGEDRVRPSTSNLPGYLMSVGSSTPLLHG